MEIAASRSPWTKANSPRIGGSCRRTRSRRSSISVTSSGSIARPGRGTSGAVGIVAFLAEWLDFSDETAGDEWRERSLLCAPLVGRDGVFGVLKVAARHSGRLTRTTPDSSNASDSQAAQAIDILNRTESLEARMLTAERRHAMAELARGVSHDVNNALGSMLPAGPADARRRARRQPGPGRCSRATSSRSRNRSRYAGGSSAACCRSPAAVYVAAAPATCAPPSKPLWLFSDTGIERRGLELVIDVPPDDTSATGCLRPVRLSSRSCSTC